MIGKETSQIARILADLGALPTGVSPKEAQDLFASCYPLHPVSLLILPTLCQRVAQNERTLFSYLGSHEPHGFVDSMFRLSVKEQQGIDWIRPDEIYEYFILNQPGLMSDQGTHRRWAEVVTALDRLGDAPVAEVELLKTIGLLNIIGAQGGLKASDGVLNLCLGGRKREGGAAREVAQALINRSIITYRRFNHEYRVWQGSDFDLEGAIRDQRAQIGKVDPSDVLNELMPLPAIVARRHAIETGTLRYFSPVFASAASVSRIVRTETPTIFVCLAETPEEADVFRERLVGIGMWHSPAVICGTGGAIKEAVTDVLALRRVQQQSAELANDPVGQRELKDKLSTSLRTERELISAIFEEPEQYEWVIGRSREPIRSKRELQNKLSALLDKVYSKAPIIRNELINRERPSSTAIAGRKKLLVAMLDYPKVEDLGIDKFPAEKAMYRAVLRATGLHAYRNRQWQFQPPSASHVQARLQPMWNAVQELLKAREGAPLSLASIYDVLSEPPYGIKAGMLPILVLALYQAMRQELALTENGQFVPFLTREVLEGLLKDPKIYAVQHFRIDSSCNKLFECYAEAITGEIPDQANLISVLQPLAKLMVGLPDYTKQTKRLTEEAQAIRNLFFASKTPVELIFSELPKALGFERMQNLGKPKHLKAFADKFRSALTELRVAYHVLLQDIVAMLKRAFALNPKLGLDEVRSRLRGRCEGLNTYTIDPQCKAFIGRLVENFGDETQWLVSLASFLARKPPEKWMDDDFEGAGYRLTELAARVRDLWKLQLHYEDARTAKHGDLEASLIRIISTRGGERQAFVTLDEQGRHAVQKRVNEVWKMLDSLPNDALKLATLVQVVRDIIPQDENKTDEEEVMAKDADKKGVA